jgi:hypothetical protein
MAEFAVAELTPARDDKHKREEGEVPSNKLLPKKKAKPSLYCKIHGPDQRHNTGDSNSVHG